MGWLELFEPVLKSVRQGSRRSWMGEGRAHLEYRPVSQQVLSDFGQRVEEAFRRLRQVTWVEINPYTRRVVVAFEPGAYSLGELEAVLEGAEKAMGALSPFDRAGVEHPADEQPVRRAAVEVGANLVGIGLGVALRLSPLPELGIGAGFVAAMSVARKIPTLRRVADEWLGEKGTEHVFQVIAPLGYGVSQRHLSQLVDLTDRLAALGEQQARRQVWLDREAELCTAPSAGVARAETPPPARPLPPGPIEQYESSAWQVALGAFGVSLVATRSIRRSAATLFVGLPKPATLGRETFASLLGRSLAARGVLVRDPAALRRLDRVDCLVLQGDLVPRQRFLLGSVTAADKADFKEARTRARALFRADEPLDVRSDGLWSIGPVPLLGVEPPAKLRGKARELGKSGALVLGLVREGELVALVDVQISAQTGVEELIAAAREAQLRVVVSTSDATSIRGFDADDLIGEGKAMVRAIRRLQDEGHVVCVVASGASPGLGVADCSIGLVREGEPTPWGAHLIGSEDLSDARFVLQACLASRRASQQSVRIAAGAAALGGFLSAGGIVPMNARRAMFLVNSATLLSMGNGARVAYDLASSPLPAPRDPTPWHALDPDGVLARLESTRVGLDASLAARRARQLRGGPIAAGVQGTVELGRAILDEVLNPLVPLLAAGAGMSAFVGSLVDAGMVVGVVGLNAVLGGVQRFSTERAVRGLSRREQRRAVVLRVGERLAVGADDLVRGDVIILEAGDVVPADCRILEAVALEVDASSLTGESLPVNKRAEASFAREVGERSSMLHEGTVIAAGHARAVIVAVGQETEARRGEVQGQGVRPRTGVEARLAELMSLTAPVAAAAGLGLVVAGVARGHRLDKIIGSAVSLAVASVPEGLPLLATAAQLASASRLSRRGALVKHPRSIEALGRVDVLCFDKTGTVTQGRLALGRVSDGRTDEALDGVRGARRRALEVALRASPEGVLDASQPDAVDEALVRGALQLGLRGARPARRGELSFEARRGFHAVLSEVEGVATLSVKGAPEVVLPRCDRWAEGPLDDAARAHLAAEIERFASRGRRVLAVAERPYPADGALDDEAVSGLYFSGFLIFSDPVRPSARSAVAALKRAGIDVVLITGDHPSTAEAIAADLDLRTGGSLTGSELDELTDEQLEGRLAGVRVFARVTPAQKVRVVQSLQRAGRVVAMAGDGANDAPAIRLADVGIAMGERSTAAARGAADVILANERIETLVDAVLEGRTMWSSVRDAVSVLIGGNLGEIGYTVGVGLVDEVTPLNARQLLLVNLLTDVAPAMAIALRPPPERVSSALLHEGPEAALGRGLYRDIALRAATTTAGAAAAWTAGRLTGSVDRARTMGMVGLVGTQLGQTLTSGEVTTPVAVAGLGSAALLFVVVQTPGLSQFFGCTPLGPGAWATALGASTLATAAMSALSEGSLSLPWRYATRLDAASQGPRPVLDE